MAIKLEYMQDLAKLVKESGMHDEANYLEKVFGTGEEKEDGTIDNGYMGLFSDILSVSPPNVDTETIPVKVKINMSTLNLGVKVDEDITLPIKTIDGSDEIIVDAEIEINPCWTMIKELSRLASTLGTL